MWWRYAPYSGLPSFSTFFGFERVKWSPLVVVNFRLGPFGGGFRSGGEEPGRGGLVGGGAS